MASKPVHDEGQAYTFNCVRLHRHAAQQTSKQKRQLNTHKVSRSLQGCPRHRGIELLTPDQNGALAGKIDRCRNHITLSTGSRPQRCHDRVRPSTKWVGRWTARRQRGSGRAKCDFQIRRQVVGLEITAEFKHQLRAFLMDSEATLNRRFGCTKTALHRRERDEVYRRRCMGSGWPHTMNKSGRAGHKDQCRQKQGKRRMLRLDDHADQNQCS